MTAAGDAKAAGAQGEAVPGGPAAAPTAGELHGAACNRLYREAWERLQAWEAEASRRRQELMAEYQSQRLALKGRTAGKKQAELDEGYRPLAAVLSEERAQIEALRKMLQDRADALVPAPEGWQVVDRSHDGSYSTQVQPSFYARHYLSPNEEVLKGLGFRVEVKRSEEDPRTWELWSDCPPWQYHAMIARGPLRTALDVWRRHGANARVYLPTLPWSADDA